MRHLHYCLKALRVTCLRVVLGRYQRRSLTLFAFVQAHVAEVIRYKFGVTFSDFKVKKKSKKVSIQSMTFIDFFMIFFEWHLTTQSKKSHKKSRNISWLFLTESWLLSQEKVIKSLLTFPDFLDFFLDFLWLFSHFTVKQNGLRSMKSQRKVRDFIDFAWPFLDFSINFLWLKLNFSVNKKST